MIKMSFSPLPAELESDLNMSRYPLLELGCGDGRFTRVLRAVNPDILALDLRQNIKSENPDIPNIVADARHLPLKPGACRMLLAANLLRHLIGPQRDFNDLETWLEFLPEGGVLWILEDDPQAEDAAERNYRDLQGFLCRVFPAMRGPLIAQDLLLQHVDRRGERRPAVSHGRLKNEYQVDSPENVYIMLARLFDEHPEETTRLHESIRKHGLRYGTYWWVRIQRSGW